MFGERAELQPRLPVERGAVPDGAQKPIRVLLFEPYLFGIYGNTRYILSIYKYLDRSRFQLILGAPVVTDFVELVRQRGGDILDLKGPARVNRYAGSVLGDGWTGRLLTLFALLFYNIKIAFILRREQIDVVACHSIRALLTVGLAAKLSRRPCFWYIKGALENRWLDRLGFSLADRIVFQSDTTRSLYYPKLIEHFRNKVTVIGNGIDFDDIRAAQAETGDLREELDLAPTGNNLVCVAQLYPLKGIEYLISAFDSLSREFPQCKLYLIGDAGVTGHEHYVNDLRGKIAAAGLEQRVIFLGWRQDAIQIVRLMDIFVLPTLSEGVPKSVIEAMALGKPVITTCVGGIPGLVEDGKDGLLVQPRNADELARALERCLKDPELRERLGRNAEVKTRERYSIEANIRGLEKLYTELATGKL